MRASGRRSEPTSRWSADRSGTITLGDRNKHIAFTAPSGAIDISKVDG
jgi:hypothetical protein